MPYTFEEVIQNEMIKEHRKRPQPRYPIWIEGLKVFLIFMGAACAISYAAFYAGGYEAILYTVPFYVQPWLTTYVRRRWNTVIRDALLSVVFVAWLFLAPNLATGFTAMGYVVLLTGYQIIREFSYETEREAGTGVIAINAACMVLVGVLMILHRQWQFISVLNILTIGYAVLFLKYRHYMTIEELIGTEKGSEEKSNFSEQRVREHNNRMFWVFCAIIILIIVVVNEAGTEEVLVRNIDKIVIRVEENLNHGGQKIKPIRTTPVLEEQVDWLKENYEFTLARLFGYIIRWILMYWYVLAIIVFILYMIKEDYMRRKEKRKYEKLEYSETKEFYKGTAPKRFRRSLVQLLDRSEENLVRRAYYKRVKGEIGKTVERSDTPMQVGEKLPDAKELTKRYNEIRYKGDQRK